ncbi:hypothetical protein FKM82_017816, partial [Ascaphus truei]
GTYIRTSDGRIFAIRASGKQKEGRRAATSGLQGSSGQYLSNGSHSSRTPPPDDAKEPTRLYSPDSPEILSELQHYAEAASGRGSRSAPNLLLPEAPLQAPNPQGRKRKEPPGRWHPSKRPSYPQLGYPNAPGFTPSALNHALSRSGNSVYMGSGGGSSHFQLPALLSDPQMGLLPDSLLTASSAATSAPASEAPYLLPPSYPLPFTQPLLPQTRMFPPFPSPLLSRGLATNSSASTFPSYLSSHSAYSASPPAGESRPLLPEEAELGSSEDEGRDDDDVVEVTGK